MVISQLLLILGKKDVFNVVKYFYLYIDFVKDRVKFDIMNMNEDKKIYV